MPAQTIVVKTECGSTEGNLAYYAEGEPRLLKIREAFLSGKRTSKEVVKAVAKITGRYRLEQDWKEVTKGKRAYAEKQKAWDEHVEANPAVNRLYGSEVIIAEFVMASEEVESE